MLLAFCSWKYVRKLILLLPAERFYDLREEQRKIVGWVILSSLLPFPAAVVFVGPTGALLMWGMFKWVRRCFLQEQAELSPFVSLIIDAGHSTEPVRIVLGS